MEDDIILKNGNVATDPRLGRIPQFDERSRNFNMRSLFTADHAAPRSYRWRCLQWLDQLDKPSCVGHAWSHELIARPKEVVGITNESALLLYHRAQQLDEWSGESYDGSSILGGAKAVVELGKMTEYRWTFSTLDLAISVSYFGSAVIGINWYTSMFNTDAEGFVTVGGELAGGHAILCRGFNVAKNAFILRNSWGAGWGISGDCWMRFEDMDRLLHEQGEACLPVVRIK